MKNDKFQGTNIKTIQLKTNTYNCNSYLYFSCF